MSKGKLAKSELMEAIRTERARLETVLACFSDVQKLKPLLENGWSIRDLLAHITSWEKIGFDIVKTARDGEALKPYIAKVFESIDNFNAKTLEINKANSLWEIEAEFHATYQDLMDLVEPLDDSFIASNLPFEGAEELSVQFMISANTHFHYREHAEALEKLLDAKV